MKIAHLISILLLGLILVACTSSQPQRSSNSGIINAAPAPTITSVPTTTSIPTYTSVPTSPPVETQAQANPDELIRIDNQGVVEISIQPLNLDNPEGSIVFEVSMNTHSVDLGMDLAPLSTLSTDNGNSSQAIFWDGAFGGHHVSGKLTFPAQVDGKVFLEGASKITLTIVDVDVQERTFVWDLGK